MRDATLPRVLVRAAECALFAGVALPRPVLDLGSGDGSFAAALFDKPLEVGVDPWRTQMLYSRRLGVYRELVQAAGESLPFPDGTFASVISNSTLEHTKDPAPIIAEMARVARSGATCVITVPSEHFPEYLLGSTVLNAVRLRPLADAYGRFMNRISRHIHIEPPSVWQKWLEDAGFRVVEWRYYFSRTSTMLLDLGHYLSAPSILTHAIAGRWVLWPDKTRYIPFRKLLGPVSQPGSSDKGAYIFFRCLKD